MGRVCGTIKRANLKRSPLATPMAATIQHHLSSSSRLKPKMAAPTTVKATIGIGKAIVATLATTTITKVVGVAAIRATIIVVGRRQQRTIITSEVEVVIIGAGRHHHLTVVT